MGRGVIDARNDPPSREAGHLRQSEGVGGEPASGRGKKGKKRLLGELINFALLHLILT